MNHPTALPRILFLGTTGRFSLAVLERLLAAGVPIAAVVTPSEQPGAPPIAWLEPAAGRSPLPLATPYLRRSILELAWEHAVPALAIHSVRHPDTHTTLARFGAMLGCVACFPWRLPTELLRLTSHGFLNVHPALLPAHRGPAPLFWTLRAGETTTGVTIHWMDEHLDSGPIVLQREIALPEGIGYDAAEHLLAGAGGELLAEALRLVMDERLARRAQEPGGSYEPWPGDEDFIADSAWPARRAYIFLRGIAEWDRPLQIRLPDGILRVSQALSYDLEATLDRPLISTGSDLLVRCAPGVLRVRAAGYFASPPNGI